MYQLSIDYAHQRFELNGAFAFPGGYVDLASARAPVSIRMVADGKRFLFYDPSEPGSSYTFDTTGSAASSQLNRFMSRAPLARLRRALEGLASVRYLGTEGAGNQRQDAVGFIDTDGRPVTLYFSRTTHLLNRVESIADGAAVGDEVSAQRFFEYETVDGLAVPKRVDETQNAILVGRFRRTAFSVQQPLPDTLVTIPAGYTRPSPASALSIRAIGDGVHLVEGIGGSYRSLVVDTEEGVLVFEAPVSVTESERAAALIERSLPGRSIRYLAVSHHHSDHIAGIRAYLARRATILVAGGSREYIENRLRDPHTVGKPVVSGPTRSTRGQVQAVARRRTFGRDGASASVEIIDVGPTSHATAMLIAYVPSQKLLFAGDLLQLSQRQPLARSTQDLADIIRRLNLDVATIVPVHGPIATRSELDGAVARAQQR
jgi:glyoxylase-like metal-dependent hydrolase (beta-lactamase superfamily II)